MAMLKILKGQGETLSRAFIRSYFDHYGFVDGCHVGSWCVP
jgi:hypothetical protein